MSLEANKEKSAHPASGLFWLIGLFLSWLGLAGLADNIVEWKAWFDMGVMEHWRAVQFWLIERLFYWVPFEINPALIDYLVVAGVFLRALLSTFVIEPEDLKNTTILILMYIGLALFWPFGILIVFVGMLQDSEMYQDQTPEEAELSDALAAINAAALKRFMFYLISFIPVLFVASDLIDQFG